MCIFPHSVNAEFIYSRCIWFESHSNCWMCWLIFLKYSLLLYPMKCRDDFRTDRGLVLQILICPLFLSILISTLYSLISWNKWYFISAPSSDSGFETCCVFVGAIFWQDRIHSAVLRCITDPVLRQTAFKIPNCFLRVTAFYCWTSAVGVWW
jgi:hypothetical protein